MIKRYSSNLSVSKVFRVFERARFPVKRSCLRCKYRGLSRLSNHRYYCRRCGYKFSPLTNTYLSRSFLPLDQWYELLWWFAHEFTANKTAKEVDLPQQRTHTCFSTIRRSIYDYQHFEMKHLLGQAKKVATSDDTSNKTREGESEKYYAKASAVKLYNGARIQKTPVFSLYELDSRVYVVPRTEIKKNTLRDILKGRIVLEPSMNEYYGRKHQKLLGVHRSEEFWGYLKERLLKHHGISKKNLIYYIKENEFRFNQRHLRKRRLVEKLISILLTPPP